MTRASDNAIDAALRRTAAPPLDPRYAAAPDGRPTPPLAELPVAWGKATAAWSSGTPNVLTLNPCDPDGGNVDAGTTITCYLLTPTGSAPAFCLVAEDDVVAYVPFGEDQGVAVNAPLWPGDANWPLRIAADGELYFDADLAGVGATAPCFEVKAISGVQTLFLKDLSASGSFPDNNGVWWDVDTYGRVTPA